MTIATVAVPDRYLGNGATKIFDYNWRIIANTDVEVTVVSPAGVETALTRITDYTVTGVGAATGGDITLVDASQAWLTSGFLTTGWGITLRRVRPVTQGTDIKNLGRFRGKAHEDFFDHSIMLDQQFAETLGRQLTLPVTEAGTPAKITIPSLADRQGNFLAFNASGELIASAGTPGAVAVSTFTETLLGTTDWDAAQNAIGFDRGANIVASATTDLGNATGNMIDITHASGVLAITSFGAAATMAAGTRVLTRFSISGGNLSVTHNATSMILPMGNNLPLLNGDICVWRKNDDASANWFLEAILFNNWQAHHNFYGEDVGANIASGTTVDLGAATGNTVVVTHSSGTTAIASKGGTTTVRRGVRQMVRYNITGGTLSLTHHATNLVLPGAANITLADGDVVEWLKESDTAAEWRAVRVQRATGQSVSSLPGVAQTRFIHINTTSARLAPEFGNLIDINGEEITVAAAGRDIITTDNLLTATGTDSGGAMTASALFHIYASNSSASFAPNTVKGSTTAPTAFRGDLYLAATGNGAHWRHVGWVQTDGSTQFNTGEDWQAVKSRFNRKPVTVRATPGYVNDNAETTFTYAVATFAAANGGTGSKVNFITDGVEDVKAHALTTSSPFGAGRSNLIAISKLDSTANVDSSSRNGNASVVTPQSADSIFKAPTEGVHTIDIMVAVSSAEAGTFRASHTRLGSDSDPRETVLTVEISG